VIHNKVEEHAQDAYQALRQHFPAFCGCEICHADVLVYALNRLPARYVASEEGRVITELALEKQQNRVGIDVALMEAFRKVQASPRCKGGRKLEP
jgi:competence protein ComFB